MILGLLAALMPPATLAAKELTPFLRDLQVTSGAFTQEKYIKKYQVSLRSQGEFALSDQTLVWTTKVPKKSTTTFTQTSVTTFMGGEERTTNLEAGSYGATITSLFLKLLQFDPQGLEDAFFMTQVKQEHHWTLTLQPKNADIFDGTIRVRLPLDGGKIIIHIDTIDGDRTKLHLIPDQPAVLRHQH